MPESPDELQAWLDRPVEPMLPPPGTFELIRARARRRKITRASMAAAAATVVVVGVASAPRLLAPQPGPGRPLASATTPRPHVRRSPRHRAESPPPPSPTAITPTTPPPIQGTLTGAVPPHFQPASITFVNEGGLGYVIGQAGTPGHCANVNPAICTSVAETTDYGTTWQGVPAPPTGAPNGPDGVGQIRFADQSDGWAFGPQLWATHDGSQTWTRIRTGGLRVTALAALDGRVFAIWARCTGPQLASDCTSFALYSSPSYTNQWAPVAGAQDIGASTGNDSVDLLLTGAGGYLLGPDGLLAGPLTGGGWHQVSGNGTAAPAPCAPGLARPDGTGSTGMLASTGPGSILVLLCAGTPGAGSQGKTLFFSRDGGATWKDGTAPPTAGVAASLSGSPGGAVLLATDQGVELTAGVKDPWQPVPGSPAGGFSYVGMTNSTQGVAIPATPGSRSVWFTSDSGASWQGSRVQSPSG